MRNRRLLGGLLLTLAALPLPSTARAQDPGDDAPAPRASRRAQLAPPVDDVDADAPDPAPIRSRRAPAATPIGSHQIDRYEAIRQLRQSVKANPNALGDWIILGELAHEAALNLPTDQDDAYYQLSRTAYERALRLDPSNPGLKAAVQLARDQEANAVEFDNNRTQAVRTYLDARRREVAASGNAPTIQVYRTASVPANDLSDDDPSSISRGPAARKVTYPAYQPYSPPRGRPVTYQQYSDSFAPPATRTSSQAPPTTLRGIADELPSALLNDLKRNALGSGRSTPR